VKANRDLACTEIDEIDRLQASLDGSVEPVGYPRKDRLPSGKLDEMGVP
jgi:hypothetical protein